MVDKYLSNVNNKDDATKPIDIILLSILLKLNAFQLMGKRNGLIHQRKIRAVKFFLSVGKGTRNMSMICFLDF